MRTRQSDVQQGNEENTVQFNYYFLLFTTTILIVIFIIIIITIFLFH